MLKETRNGNATAATVFTDSSAAMTKMGKKFAKLEGLAVGDNVYQRAKEIIKNGHSVALLWIPGHSKIEGNEKAYSAAKIAAEETDRLPEFTYSRENRAKKKQTSQIEDKLVHS